MIKKVIITNGSGRSGKDTFAEILNKYFDVYKYSSIDIVKDMTEICGVDRNDKSEKTRKLWSDLKALMTEYSDVSFNDISKIVRDFNCDLIQTEFLLIDIREPHEIDRAKQEFDAFTVLIKNDNVTHITSNISDGSVFDYEYDFVVDNSGNLNDLEEEVRRFIRWMNGGI